MADDKERSQIQQKRLNGKRQPLCASSSYSCHKLWLFLYILFHLLSGLALLAIGILVEIERREYSGLEKWLALPTAILIFIGLIVSINGLCGCVGTMEENVALIKLFFVISIITFICQISLAVLVYSFGQNVSHSKSKEVADQIFTQENYGKNYEIQQAVHRLQVKYSCCGMQSWHDYVDNLDTCRQRCAYTDAASGHACQYRCIFPESCCMDSKAPATSHTLSCSSEKVSEAPASMTTKPGCFGMFFDWLVGRLDLIGGTVFGLALPQVAGLVWTFLVLRRIKEYQSWYTVELTNENEML